MQFFLALLVWLLIGVAIGGAIFATVVKGMVWALPLVSIVFLVMFYHYGCKTH
ncbi:MAG: hypothetical protein ACK4UN_12305 [Limisphaerales bacterium]